MLSGNDKLPLFAARPLPNMLPRLARRSSATWTSPDPQQDGFGMRPELRRPLIVVAAALFVFFTWLGKPYLWDEDEPKNAECAREMLEADNWVVPQFNYQLRTDKPILLYWLMLSSYKTFGVNEFAARFWSAALAVGTCWLTYGIARKLYGSSVGLWAGLALAGSLMFAVSGRAATPDSTLIFCTTLAMFAFVRFGGTTQTTLSRGGYVALYGAAALAVLAKGPVGIVLPGGVWGLFLLCRRQQQSHDNSTTQTNDATPARWRRVLNAIFATLAPRRLLEVTWSLRPLTALAVLTIVALPWYVLVGYRTDGAWLAGFLGKHNVARFTGAMEGHSGPIFYYVIAVLVGFFPWSCFLGPAIYRLVRRLSTNEVSAGEDALSMRASDTFVACWAGLYLGFFSLARTKLPSYVLPCYPALAIITAVYVDEAVRRLAAVPKFWYRAGLASPLIVGVLLGVGLPIAAYFAMPGFEWLGVVGIPLIVGGLAIVAAEHRGRTTYVPALFAVTALAFTTVTVAGVASRLSQSATSPQLVAAAHAERGPDARLIGFRHFEPTLAFYARSEVPLVHSAESLRAALAANPQACIVTRDEYWNELAAALGTEPEVLLRQRRFLRRNGEIIIALPTSTATAERIVERTQR